MCIHSISSSFCLLFFNAPSSVCFQYLPSSLTLLKIPILVSCGHHDTLSIGGRCHSRPFVSFWKLHAEIGLLTPKIDWNQIPNGVFILRVFVPNKLRLASINMSMLLSCQCSVFFANHESVWGEQELKLVSEYAAVR